MDQVENQGLSVSDVTTMLMMKTQSYVKNVDYQCATTKDVKIQNNINQNAK